MIMIRMHCDKCPKVRLKIFLTKYTENFYRRKEQVWKLNIWGLSRMIGIELALPKKILLA